MQCTCHSQKPYQECCAPYHQGTLPPTCELLMRSRYSAYSLGLIDYILATTHPSLPVDRASVEQFYKNTRFEGLEILETTENTVTFKATLFQGKHDISFIEKSTFIKEDSKWLYALAEIRPSC